MLRQCHKHPLELSAVTSSVVEADQCVGQISNTGQLFMLQLIESLAARMIIVKQLQLLARRFQAVIAMEKAFSCRNVHTT